MAKDSLCSCSHEQMIDVMPNRQRSVDLACRRQSLQQIGDFGDKWLFGRPDVAENIVIRHVERPAGGRIKPINTVGNWPVQILGAEDGTRRNILGAAQCGDIALHLPAGMQATDVVVFYIRGWVASHDGDD